MLDKNDKNSKNSSTRWTFCVSCKYFIHPSLQTFRLRFGINETDDPIFLAMNRGWNEEIHNVLCPPCTAKWRSEGEDPNVDPLARFLIRALTSNSSSSKNRDDASEAAKTE